MAASAPTGRDALRRKVAALDWYHTIELAPGVRTPGWFDMADVVSKVRIPADLSGKRCLDVGTFDGYWAFEMERRGADEVVAIDILDPEKWDWPVGRDPRVVQAIGQRKAQGAGFELAVRELGSSVRRLEMSVYDLTREELGGFDLVYVGSILIHLRDPVRALEAIRDVTDGRALIVDGIDVFLSLLLPRMPVVRFDGLGRPWWWWPNIAALARMIESAGLDHVTKPRRLFMPPGDGQPLPRVHPRLLFNPNGREQLTTILKGDPHAIFEVKPRPDVDETPRS